MGSAVSSLGGLGSSVGKALGSTLGPLVGASGGANGTGYAKPDAANITPGTSQAQIGQAYTGNQNSLQSQQALLSALQSQNGTGLQNSAANQMQGLAGQQTAANSVGAQQQALQSQQGLNQQFGSVNGVQNQNAALQAQQGLSQQYQNIANGVGPNPAQAMLNQQTGQNVANQASLMAGQRGASSNVGLLARQSAQQGAATQQQAVGQGATMQANQSLNALSGIGAANQNVANIAGQQIGQQQTGINAAQQAASNMTAQQQAQQQNLAGLGTTLTGQQIAGTTANTQAQQSEQQLLQQALSSQNQANVAMQSNVNAANSGLANTNIQGQQGLMGGALNSIGSAVGIGAGALSQGGEVRHFDDGGLATSAATPSAPIAQTQIQPPSPTGPQSALGKFLKGTAGGLQTDQGKQNNENFNMAPNTNFGAQSLQKGAGNFGGGLKNLMNSTTSASPSNSFTGSDIGGLGASALAAKGGMLRKDFTAGGKVNADSPREKAVKKGNSYDNDKIPALLSEHEIVIPRSITQGKDPVNGAAQFVAQVMAKRGQR